MDAKSAKKVDKCFRILVIVVGAVGIFVSVALGLGGRGVAGYLGRTAYLTSKGYEFCRVCGGRLRGGADYQTTMGNLRLIKPFHKAHAPWVYGDFLAFFLYSRYGRTLSGIIGISVPSLVWLVFAIEVWLVDSRVRMLEAVRVSLACMAISVVVWAGLFGTVQIIND